MQKKTKNYVTGALAGLAVTAAVIMIKNNKCTAGICLRKNVNRLGKSVNGIADSLKLMFR